MDGVPMGLLIFVLLTAAALVSLWLHPRLPERQRQEATHNVVKLAIGMIVVMTSLVLGLLITSVKNTYDGVDANVHAFSTQLILLDRALKLYGPETEPTRSLLTSYVERALAGTWPEHGEPVKVDDEAAGDQLNKVEQALKAVKPPDAQRQELWNAALARLQKVVELRWTLIEQSASTVSKPILVVLIGWLMLIFASFAYNAPRNAVVVVTLLLCTASIAASVYLIIEMDTPFSGVISVSPEPVERALAYMRR
jgi:hypothetical protein